MANGIGNRLDKAIVTIYTTAKTARREARLTDQEFVLIAASLKEIERLFQEEHERHAGGEKHPFSS